METMSSNEFRSHFGLMAASHTPEQLARVRAEAAPILASLDTVRAAYARCRDLDEAIELTDRLVWGGRGSAPDWLDDPVGILYVATLASGEVLALMEPDNGQGIGHDVVAWQDAVRGTLVWNAWAAHDRGAFRVA